MTFREKAKLPKWLREETHSTLSYARASDSVTHSTDGMWDSFEATRPRPHDTVKYRIQLNWAANQLNRPLEEKPQ